jgi:hypothetical protein
LGQRRGAKILIVRNLIISLIVSVSVNSGFSQSSDYKEIFGDDWNKALSFERENRSWMEPILVRNHIPYPLAIAVIFPELVRYSALRDKMEITLLKALYINLGDEYANFSIGQFQMKPSFAEIIREQASSVLGRRSEIVFKNPSEYDGISNFRKSIINDLEDPRTQLNYLIVFFKICEKNYKTNRMEEYTKVKFLATAYNYGIDRSAASIEAMIDKKYFNTKIYKTENYCYSEISAFWYKNTMTDR